MHRAALALSLLCLAAGASAQVQDFRVVAFYTGKEDLAHISFVNEANTCFPNLGRKLGFTYEATTDWSRLNDSFLGQCQVVLFLDSRPEVLEERRAFQRYMERGGSWMGFHFAAFALTPSKYPQDWDWYHDVFLGSGSYVSNTWRPTSAILRVESRTHPATKGLPTTFTSAPNEWYRWEKDLRANPDIDILLSIDPASFPLGTGPKPEEIWHAGYYPVAWTNKKYRMIYLNMGHNDMDYAGGTNRRLSSTFSSADENQLIANSLLWLGRRGP